jgi:tetratricopeptide (TPR) repeat protein
VNHSHVPAGGVPAAPVVRPSQLVDARGRPYEPAVGPRLRILLAFIFACVAVLGATAVYLVAIRLMEWKTDKTYTNAWSMWIFMVHVVIGVVLVAPFLTFGFIHLASARHRTNRLAVRLGMTLFATAIVVGISGLALIQLAGMPQVPSGLVRTVILTLHGVAPVIAVGLYVLHRRAGPDIQWRWGAAWGGAVAAFVLVMGGLHWVDPRPWYQKGPREGEKYYEPAKTRTAGGKFISEQALMMDSYCLKCHQDVYKSWFHSAHHFSSFNNPPYLFSVEETRRVALKRDGNVRASRWCAGCHDPVPFLSGQFDNPDFDTRKHPTSQAGITCVVCHAMVNVNSTAGNGDYTIEEPQQYPFAYSDNPVLQWLNNQVVKAKPGFHKKTFLKPFHKTAEFCSTCHKVSIPMALNHYKEFLRGQNHYDTFLLSGVGGSNARAFYYPPKAKTKCAECHMPLQPSADFGSKDFDGSGIRKGHSHGFGTANTGLFWLLSHDPKHRDVASSLEQGEKEARNFLRGSDPLGPADAPVAAPPVRIDLFGLKTGGTTSGRLIAPLRPKLPVLEPGKSYLVEVVIRTLGLGHPLPQGTADSNEIWVDFTARSGRRVIGRSGALDQGPDKGRVDKWAHFVNVLMLDRHGNRINRRNPQDIFTPLYDHQIPPGAAQVVHYDLHVPKNIEGPVELTVKLRYRKFDFEYMSLVSGGDSKVPPLPVVDLCQDSVTLPVAGMAPTVPAQTSPIKPPWQRWNDYGIGCLLEGGVDAKKGELIQAEEAFQHLLTDPATAEEAHGHAYVNLARVYNVDGRLDKAVEVLRKAVKADPPAPAWTVAWFNGLVNAQNGYLDRAIADFESILDPKRQLHSRNLDFTKDYVVIDQLGKTLFDRAQQETDDAERDRFLRRAVEQFERTLALDSEDLDAHYGLSQCYAQLGHALQVSDKGKVVVPPDEDGWMALCGTIADTKEAKKRRLEAAFQLGRAVAVFGQQATEPDQPKLPLLQELTKRCRPLFHETEDAELGGAAAFVLGHLHRQQHAIYNPDPNARDAAVAVYRRTHKAAGAASQAIVVYPLSVVSGQ